MNVTIYHDCRSPRKDGTAPLKLYVRVRDARTIVTTDICVKPEQYDKEAGVIVGHPRGRFLNERLREKWFDAERIAYDMERKYRNVTAEQLRRAVESGDTEPHTKFLGVFRMVATDSVISPRTQELYACTLKKVIAFAQDTGQDAEAWEFEDITRTWAARFDKWLSRTSPSKNARNIHLRNVRHVCNVAVSEHLTTFYDFHAVHLKDVPTRKRSLTAEQMRAFLSLDVKPHQRQYLDMFRLIFCLIGINSADLFALTKESIVGGRIEYDRAKTGRHYSIKIEPEAADIIKRYEGKKTLLEPMDRYKDFRDYAHRLNENLQKMGEVTVGKYGKKTRKPMFPDITTYWARHTWATIAASLDIPNETIAAALGHTYGNRVTAVYIDFDMKKVDDANRRVIDWVMYGKK